MKTGKGIKVTFNELLNVFMDKPIKITMKIWVDGNIDYDIKNNFMIYNT